MECKETLFLCEDTEDCLFPFLSESTNSEKFDLWAATTMKVYKERIKKMQWLSQRRAGHWLTYIVMYDYLDLSVLQYWVSVGNTWLQIRRRVYNFFYGK
jgi:hypothetical protein